MKQLGPHLDEEEHLGRDAVRRSPGAPVRNVHPDLQVDEPGGQRGGHAVGDATVALPVTAGDERGAVGELVLAAAPVEHELVQGRLDHGHGRGQLLQVDEPAALLIRRRKEGRRRPAGAVGAVAPGDAAQVHGVEKQRPDVDIFAAGIGGHLLGDSGLGAPGRPPNDGRLAGLNEQGQGPGELARAERVIGGDGVGIGHGQLRIKGMSRRGNPLGRPAFARHPARLRLLAARSAYGERKEPMGTERVSGREGESVGVPGLTVRSRARRSGGRRSRAC